MTHVEPSLGVARFNCPYCGAFAHHTWYTARGEYLHTPHTSVGALRQHARAVKAVAEGKRSLQADEITDVRFVGSRVAAQTTLVSNLLFSRCTSCDEVAVWKDDRIVYPRRSAGISPNPDLPANVRDDFLEAAEVLDVSPRSAAALLRLCIQKLMPHLGEKGENINDDIAGLVRKGLDVQIQKALDLVRVIGNNAVHPGNLDLRDDKPTATKLFHLVNMIAYDRITRPAEIALLYEEVLTPGQKEQVETRDTKVKK